MFSLLSSCSIPINIFLETFESPNYKQGKLICSSDGRSITWNIETNQPIDYINYNKKGIL